MSADRVEGESDAAPPRRARPRRRVVVGGIAIIVLLVVAVAAGLAAFRYLPALDEARALRTDLETMVDRVKEAGLGIDGATMDALDADLASARGRFDRLESLLADDPLVALARVLPPTAANVRGADDVVAAAGNLLDAVGEGLVIGRRFVEIREAQAADPAGASALSQLVELMATTRDSAVSIAASITSARQALAAVPDGLVGQVESVRDAMMARIDTYGPLLDTYVAASARLPAILGWDGPRRYLVLTQDPAELRPTGGFIGSYGIVAFDRGRITERRFQDVDPPGLPVGLPAHRAAAGAVGLPARAEAAVAVRRRQLVAGLPDERAGCDPPLHERVRRHEHRRRARDHHLHDRRAPQAHRTDRGPRVRRHDRHRRDDPQGAPADALCRRPARIGRPSCRRSRTGCSPRSSPSRPGSGATSSARPARSARVTCWRPGSGTRRTRSLSRGAASTGPCARTQGTTSTRSTPTWLRPRSSTC